MFIMTRAFYFGSKQNNKNAKVPFYAHFETFIFHPSLQSSSPHMMMKTQPIYPSVCNLPQKLLLKVMFVVPSLLRRRQRL